MIRNGQRRCRRDRGVTLIEFAFVLPLLVLLAYGTAELGLAWTAENRIQSAVSQAARVGVSSGSQREADRDLLLALQVSLEPNVLARLDRVVIYSATTADGTAPAVCRNVAAGTDGGNAASLCNSYSGNTVRGVTSASSSFSGSCATSSTSKDRFWCPPIRKDSLRDNLATGPDWLGVWIRTTYSSPLSLFFGDFTIERSAVYRIQPDSTG